MDLDHWRARIDEVDARLLQLINERLEYAVEIGKIKQAEGRQIRAPERERQVLARLVQSNSGPASARAVEEIFGRIMQEARDLERD